MPPHISVVITHLITRKLRKRVIRWWLKRGVANQKLNNTQRKKRLNYISPAIRFRRKCRIEATSFVGSLVWAMKVAR
ncbi:unnamed protein product [Sphenostylis stenocarpa]|uniref:Uncharacterized protein n=1 Tax=Sphenostylis stenocarpa TaxID=92480 RepID=A0AA86SCI4_9FABA|nr:unnamed protein product [Sphenostylis stenocarpa]